MNWTQQKISTTYEMLIQKSKLEMRKWTPLELQNNKNAEEFWIVFWIVM